MGSSVGGEAFGHRSLTERVAEWLAVDPDPVTRAELRRLVGSGAEAELADRFAGRLAFGTAGLRAEMGAGPMRMNRVVVRQAAAGLVRYLRENGRSSPLVVVGFDARHNSEDFARDSAGVIVAAGGRVVLFDRPGPTPLLAFAVQALGADAGVMVTASHNPPADNGYKVYLGDGAQIIPPADADIARCIAASELTPPIAAAEDPAISPLPGDVVAAYLIDTRSSLDPQGERSVRVAYTPLHGVGAEAALAAFAAAGFPSPHVVAEQAAPDPDFPTVPFPNPEEPGALDAGLTLARRIGADVLLANDPDADRLGVAVPVAPGTPGADEGWRVLSGDEIGVLLADHLLRTRFRDGERLVVTTVVSSRLLGRLARARGVHYAETLTGFKWIVRPALAHPAWSFVLGYEEALGFSVGTRVRDKDGIAAALVFAELVATLRQAGSSVQHRLEQLAREFGLHATRGYSLRLGPGAGGARRAAERVRRVREQPPEALAGRAVRSCDDLAAAGLSTAGLVLLLEGDARVVMRPSGTEPKLKVYLEVVEPVPPTRAYADAARSASAQLSALREALAAHLTPD